MVSVTLSVPARLRERMKQHSEVKWSEVIRRTIEQQLDDWSELDSIAKKSRLTLKDVRELSGKVDAEMARHFGGRKNVACSGR